MGVQFKQGAADVIPTSPNYPPPMDDFLDFSVSDDNFSDASQSLDELMERNSVLNGVDNDASMGGMGGADGGGGMDMGIDEPFFESLDEAALDEMAREVTSDKAFQESLRDDNNMPKLDSSDVDSSSASASADGGMSGYLGAAGSGLGLGKLKSFVLNKISSFRNMPEEETEDVGLDELLDLDDIRNASYKAAAESVRGGFGAANLQAGAAQTAA
jgi:hypothetical protein